MKDLISAEFFCGGNEKLLPNSSQKFIDDKLFLFAGQIMAASIMQDGPSPAVFPMYG